ncbi:hypothetical protein ACFYT3_31380 [Nocardia amikacinitolerans]|uniref:hypothetical protein n=1 Tax=Nocardia amikacinitolerans TaxID=756689 RepID=UPI0036B76F48
MWYGYAQAELLPERRARVAVRQAMVEYASYFGFGSGELFVEPTAPELVLHSMLNEIDRTDPAAGIVRRLEQVAASREIDLGRVLAADSPRTQVLWRVMEDIEGAGGGHVIVPSRQHLTRLGPSGNAVVQRLTQMPLAHIYFLDADLSAGRRTVDDVQASADPSHRAEEILVESCVGAIPTVTRFDVVSKLTRLGWPEVMEPVDELYVALVSDAVAAAEAAGILGFGPAGEQGVIRLLQRADGCLVVELEESRHRVDEPSSNLVRLSAHAERFTDQGCTFTRCTLPAGVAPVQGRRSSTDLVGEPR